MRNKILLCLFLTLVVISFSLPAYADLKFSWGGAERIRHEFWKNWKDMNNDALDNRNFFRIKTSLWGQVDEGKNLTLYAKLSNEFRAHTYFGGRSGSFPDKFAAKKGYHFNINEVVFDNLYADIRNFLNLPLDLRLGRQDFLGMYGEGFLIMDGTPQDGSRTFYFNAVKASWRMDDKNTLDLIYINDPRDEEMLPVINRDELVNVNGSRNKVPMLLNTTDEQGYVLYWKNKAMKDLPLEAYYIYKTEAAEGGGTGYQSKNCKLNTIGSFAKYNFSPWALRGQLAFQFGDYGTNDREGLGGYVYLDRDLKDLTWSPKASVGYIYLSGDDKSTAKNEGWDPVFSRWPWVSELYLMTMYSETSVIGYWTNLGVVRAELVLKPTKKAKLSLWYNYLMANEKATGTVLSGTSKDRGQMPQARLDYTFNKNVNGYILAEYFIPGDFYKVKDEALFLRTELQVKF